MKKQKESKLLRFGTSIKKTYEASDISKYILHLVFSVMLGVLAGASAIAFRTLLEWMRHVLELKHIINFLNIKFSLIFIVPVIGGLLVALMTRLFPAIAREGDVVSVIKAVIMRNGYIPLKNTVFHFIAPIISIGSGMPLGPEGPSAKIGSGAGSLMAQLFRLNQRDMKMYTAAGAGAAISAVFNAPIAGVFFGIEVILLNDLKNQALSALVISSVVADILSLAALGNVHVFKIPAYTNTHAADFPYLLALGILCGIASILFFKLRKFFRYLINNKFKIENEFLKLLPVAFVFGLALILYHGLYGIGYSVINEVLNRHIPLNDTIIIFFLKFLFVALFLEAGAYGGIFAPSLMLGTLMGYSFSILMNQFFGLNLNPVAFALVGMGGMLAGINCIPLTSILLVFEITNDYRFILPLMFVSIISYLAVIYANKGSTYSLELLREGIDVSKRGEINLLGKIKVKELKKKNFDLINYRTPFRELMKIFLNSYHSDLFVVNDKNELFGVISFKDIRRSFASNELVDLLIAGDIAVPVPAITDNDPVSTAIQKIDEYELQVIPVVKDPKHKKITGIVTYQDILQAYNMLLEKWGSDQFLIDYKRNK